MPETTPRPTPERLAEIETRAEAATPGPWWRHDTWLEHIGGHTATVLSGSHEPGARVDLRAWLPTMSGEPWDEARNVWADAEFMAHAREDVPTLLAAVHALAGERDARADVAPLREAFRKISGDSVDTVTPDLLIGSAAMAVRGVDGLRDQLAKELMQHDDAESRVAAHAAMADELRARLAEARSVLAEVTSGPHDYPVETVDMARSLAAVLDADGGTRVETEYGVRGRRRPDRVATGADLGPHEAREIAADTGSEAVSRTVVRGPWRPLDTTDTETTPEGDDR